MRKLIETTILFVISTHILAGIEKTTSATNSQAASIIANHSSDKSNEYQSRQVFITTSNKDFDNEKFFSRQEIIKNKNDQDRYRNRSKDYPLHLRVGYDKPDKVVWTSTLKRNSVKKNYTTSWIEWFNDHSMKHELGKSAAVFKVLDTAKIFTINSSSDYLYLLSKYPLSEDDNYIDWQRIADDYNAVHCTEDYDIPGWDCESTAWLNKDKLILDEILKYPEIDL